MSDKKIEGKDPLGIINTSGFPLQIAIKHLAAKTNPKWDELYNEHAWWNSDTGGSGFIDLVLELNGKRIVAVIECKRVQETAWLFLSEKENTQRVKNRRHAKLWCTFWNPERQVQHHDWADVALDPASPESLYCVVDGQTPKDRPMIERVASELLDATEAVAHEELNTLVQTSTNGVRIYISILVTTATLKVCAIDPEGISLTDGKATAAESVEVPLVRLRKQLSQRSAGSKEHHWLDPLREQARGKERTVFVVTATYLQQFLNDIEFDLSSMPNAFR